jgi:hypothetical protein
VTALAASDFGGDGGDDDGDLDLYLGRPASGNDFFYQAKSSIGDDAPDHAWLRVRAKAPAPSGTKLAGNNRFLLGSQVTVQQPSSGTPTWQQTQVVDGGSGYGSQAGHVLTFGIPAKAQSAKVTLFAPDGSVTTKTIAANGYNLETTIADTHSPALDNDSITTDYIATTGTTTWTIGFFHEHAAGSYEITVTEPSGCDIIEGTGIMLQPGITSGVSVDVLPVAGGYWVTITWVGPECIAPCTHNIVVKCYNSTTASQSSTHYFSVPTCGQIEEE